MAMLPSRVSNGLCGRLRPPQTVAGPSRCAMQIARSFACSSVYCSGSNKWSKVKHIKGPADLAKSAAYSKMTTEIIRAVRAHPTHSASPEINLRLAAVLQRAKAMSIPKDRIETSLKKALTIGSASPNGAQMMYEVLGPLADSGVPVAMIIECQTDNPARTMGRVREVLSKRSAYRLSSAAHMFRKQGVIQLALRSGTTFDGVFEAAVEHGAEDVRELELDGEGEEEEAGEGTETAVQGVEPSQLHRLTTLLSTEPHGHRIVESEIKMLPNEAPLRVLSALEEGEEQPTKKEIADDDKCSGWLDEEIMLKADKIYENLMEKADCVRVWSNVEGWPAR